MGHAATTEDRAIAEEIYATFASTPDDRRRLEKGAADFAGLDHGWQVVVWLPSHTMRFKVADVLVQQNGSIAPLSRVEPTSSEIVKQHQRLWGVTVYAPVDVDAPTRDAVLAYLGDKTSLRFRRPDGSIVPSRQELAVDRVVAEINVEAPPQPKLLKIAAAASDKNADGTFDSLVTAVYTGGVENNLIKDGARPLRLVGK